jgi:hypothetical protein
MRKIFDVFDARAYWGVKNIICSPRPAEAGLFRADFPSIKTGLAMELR